VVRTDAGKLYKALRGSDGKFAKEQGVNEGEYGGIGTDTEGNG
jgi:hypothetical protein